MKTLKIILLSFSICALLACNKSVNNQSGSSSYNPDASVSNTISDSEREARIAAKKAEYEVSYDDEFDNLSQYSGKLKLMPLIPYVDGMTIEEQRLIEKKMLQIIVSNGIGGIGANPRYVVAPVITELNKDVTVTAPVQYLVKYDITIVVADIITGTVFGEESFVADGVGPSESMAMASVFIDIDPKDPKYTTMLSLASQKIIDYYTENGDQFIKEAQMLASKQDYAQAMAVLGSIPTEVGECYDRAVSMMNEITPKYINKECGLALAQMKAALGRPSDENGYNFEAMSYYAMIPQNSSCRAEADSLAKAYNINISDIRKDKLEYQRLQAELQAKIQAAGNKCLMEQYKKEAAYQRLPWVRKVFYLGDLDPFDGYRPSEEC